MKKLLLLLVVLLAYAKAYAVPAYPYPVTITQPDGSSLTIMGQGDEFFHFTTTADGFTIVKNDEGFYTYAQLVDNKLQPTQYVAHDTAERTASENAYLDTVDKFIFEVSEEMAARKARQNVAVKESYSYYKNFKGLVILINFSDLKFMRSDANDLYTHMLNDENYQGYRNEDGSYNQQGAMFYGSVRDYFNANSAGMFAPHFDVVGPVDIDMKSTDVHSTSYGGLMASKAVQAADSLINYADYDADQNGTVDMIFFIAAGYGANYSGNSSNYLWPHKSSLAYYNVPALDGMKFGTYACSVEIYGLESNANKIIDGIGTVCHEFSHVLGLPDLYDTNYATGGTSHHPGSWDVMAGGSYNQYSRYPVGYSAFEKFRSGFIQIPTITGSNSYKLGELQETNEAFILKTPVAKEYFIFENRQQKGWDRYLPGHGMIVARVDSTSTSPWSSNRVNADATHNYYELLRAGGTTTDDLNSDPFPGTESVRAITNSTAANLKTWDGTENNYMVANIRESNGSVYFDVMKYDELTTLVEDFETMGATSTSGATGVEGRFCKWDFTKCNVVEPTDSTLIQGKYGVATKKPCIIATTDPVTSNPFMVSFYVNNPTTSDSKFKLQYKPVGEDTWKDATPADVTLSSKSATDLSFLIPEYGPKYIRIYQSSGSSSAKCYIDNVTFYCSKGIYVNEANFPDESFRLWVSEHIKGAEDGYLTNEELAAVTDINIYPQCVDNLSGIEYFQNLKSLNCTDAGVSDLNVSKNLLLEKLDCSKNFLTTLNLTCNTELTELNCAYNELATLNVAKNTKLASLLCNDNHLQQLDLTGLSTLSTFNGDAQTDTLKAALKMVDGASQYVVTMSSDFVNDKAKGLYVTDVNNAVLTDTVASKAGNYFVMPRNESPKSFGYKYMTNNADKALSVTIVPVYALIGDVNNDGAVDTSDITALINKILGKNSYDDGVCDVNGNGAVDTSDIAALINLILGTEG